MTQDTRKLNLEKIATLLYGIYAASMVMQFISLPSILLGTIAALAAIVVAHIMRRHASGTIYESHFQWLVRTFWIGGSVYLPALTVFSSIYLTTKIMPLVTQSMQAGDTLTQARLYELLIQGDSNIMLNTARVTIGIFALWWFARCGAGFVLLRRKQSIRNVQSWLV